MILYAAQAASVTASDLYVLDSTTAVATSIGPTGHAFTAFAFDPTSGIMYGGTTPNSAVTAQRRSLFTIDPATGDVTFIAQFNGPAGVTPMADFAFDSSGQLYGWSGQSGYIYSIDKTDASYADTLPNSGLSVPAASIEFDDDDVLYHLVRQAGVTKLYTIDFGDDGTPVLVGEITPAASLYPAAATFGPDGLLWWINGGFEGASVRLRTLDVSTLAHAVVGASSSNPGNNFDALAWGEDDGADVPAEGVAASFTPNATGTPVWTRLNDPDGI